MKTPVKSKGGRPKLDEKEKRQLFQGKFKPELMRQIEKTAQKKNESKSHLVETILIREFGL
jgi:hypothetical protein